MLIELLFGLLVVAVLFYLFFRDNTSPVEGFESEPNVVHRSFLSYWKYPPVDIVVEAAFTDGNALGEFRYKELEKIITNIPDGKGTVTLKRANYMGDFQLFKYVNGRKYKYYGTYDYDKVRTWILAVNM